MTSETSKSQPTKTIPTGAARLRAEVTTGCATIIIDYPERHNVIDLEGWLALPDLIARLARLPDMRLIVMRGAGGRAFVAGADIAQFDEKYSGPHGSHYDTATIDAFDAVAACPIPTFAAIEGYCIGGGLGLALACDLRLARDDSSFAIPAARLGLAYPPNATDRLRATVGPSHAKDILFTARRLDASQALAMGLVNYVTSTADFDTELAHHVATICTNAPLTLKAAKAVIERHPDTDQAEIDQKIAACFASADYEEGRTAFMQKRPPEFSGN
ncbi:MAG: enoyl-CoA hydratase/isomerase family protein [PS1 clade bacterium]|nr:enoyl-CoA hydratase/isomerase family protein [PS1 clade bacterium]